VLERQEISVAEHAGFEVLQGVIF